MPDRYANFAELKAAEEEGVTYRISVRERSSAAIIIAPHGGYIEHETGALATEIAGDELSLYCFEALTPEDRQPPGRQHRLHITSHHFDEPECLRLVGASELVVAIHGRADRGDKNAIYLGGLNAALVKDIAHQLAKNGFTVKTSGHQFPATEPLNICNRSKDGRGGAQIELPNSLRRRLHIDEKKRRAFVAAMRSAVAAALVN